ncbi:putative Transmembrane protein [Quillaja saponaria]|uniref:Transmembrane protein n=1 Tax=Quillaja saponaria TaxID=32244 RepID=A0AAD7QCQ2_QUISA|nr:putative Transmembrane protein [Quillaja saponaria]
MIACPTLQTSKKIYNVKMYKLRTSFLANSTHIEVVSEKFVVGMAGTLFHLLVILLGLTSITCLKAVPVTRSDSLMHGSQVLGVPENTHQVSSERIWEEKTIADRMDLELHDYPGSGANNRHTPKPAGYWKAGCADC